MNNFSVILKGVSKRYDRDWVIRDFSAKLTTGHCYGIRGRNGSGKSTLLRMMAGHLSPSRGNLTFELAQKKLPVEEVYSHIGYVAPYLDPIMELTLREMLDFHFGFKSLRAGLSLATLPEMMQLSGWEHTPISAYSSGMKQRVLLGLALFSDTPLLLLDEPTTTLDRNGQSWFQDQLAQHRGGRITVIATNVDEDLAQCDQILELEIGVGN